MAYGLPRPGDGAAWAPSENEAAALVELALARGITTFDTAPAYGESEVRLGRILGDRGAVWTKVASGAPQDSLVQSLARLRRPRVELLQWHNWTAPLGRDPAWVDAWRKLRDDPRVGRLGATTYGIDDARAAIESGMFDTVQVEFNLLNPLVVEAIADAAQRLGVTIAVRSVLLQGALTDEGRELPPLPPLRAAVARARDAAAGEGLTRLALRAALDHPAITDVLLGFDRTSQIEDATRIAAAAPLSASLRASLADLSLAGDPSCDPRTWPHAR